MYFSFYGKIRTIPRAFGTFRRVWLTRNWKHQQAAIKQHLQAKAEAERTIITHWLPSHCWSACLVIGCVPPANAARPSEIADSAPSVDQQTTETMHWLSFARAATCFQCLPNLALGQHSRKTLSGDLAILSPTWDSWPVNRLTNVLKERLKFATFRKWKKNHL